MDWEKRPWWGEALVDQGFSPRTVNYIGLALDVLFMLILLSLVFYYVQLNAEVHTICAPRSCVYYNSSYELCPVINETYDYDSPVESQRGTVLGSWI